MPFSSMFLNDFLLNEAIFLSSLQSGIEEGTNNWRELGKKLKKLISRGCGGRGVAINQQELKYKQTIFFLQWSPQLQYIPSSYGEQHGI